jgi:hypothetical protein
MKLRPPIKRLTAILLTLAILLFLWRWRVEITGLIVDTMTLLLTIPTHKYACVWLIVSDTNPPEGKAITLSALAENCGNEVFDIEVELRLLDLLNRSLFTISSDTHRLEPAQAYDLFAMQWLAWPAGTYTLRGTFSYDGVTEVKEVPIHVYVPVPPPPPVVIPPPFIVVPVPIPDMQIGFPAEMNVTQATAYAISIAANNTGTAALHNVTANASSEHVFIGAIQPEIVPVLKPGMVAWFALGIFIPPELEVGIYELNVTVSSDELSRSGLIRLRVHTLPIREKAAHLLTYYRFVLEKLETEIKRLEAAGWNVTLARTYWRAARTAFDVAKALYANMLYEESIKKADEVRLHIVEVVEALRLAVPVIVPPPPVPVLPTWLWLLVIVLLILIIVWRMRGRVIRHRRG